MEEDFDKLEKQFGKLLGLLQPSLDASEKKEIREYINVNEFGVALEALVDILVVKGRALEKEPCTLLHKMANSLGLKGEVARIDKSLS